VASYPRTFLQRGLRPTDGCGDLHPPRRVACRDLVAVRETDLHPGADCASAGVIDARWEAKRADGVVTKKAYFNFDYPASWAVFDTTILSAFGEPGRIDP
jgi:hypothetical protein